MVLLMAEFESDLIRARTREEIAEARKAGRLKGKQLMLSGLQRRRLLADYESGDYSASQPCEISGLSRSAMYATLRPGARPSKSCGADMGSSLLC